MKSLRPWLLLLLAVLLPLRGALAAGMLCGMAEAGGTPEVAQVAQVAKVAHVHGDAGHAHEHEPAPGHAHLSPAAGEHAASHAHADGPGHEHAGHADTCNLCSVLCGVTGPVSAEVSFAAAKLSGAVFPHLHAPAPSFVADGQERPPRST